MFGNIFNFGDDGDSDERVDQLLSSSVGYSSSYPSSSSSSDSVESKHRSNHGFVGLKNQGNTCYLNSLIQALYMTPEVRSAVYQLPYEDVEENEQEEVKGGSENHMNIGSLFSQTTTQSNPYFHLDFYGQCLDMGFSESVVLKCFDKFLPNHNTGYVTEYTQERILNALFSSSDEDEACAAVASVPNSDGAVGNGSTSVRDVVLYDEAVANQQTSVNNIVTESVPVDEDQASTSCTTKKTKSIPSVLQNLFAHMQVGEYSSISTQALTDSFGWESQHVSQQHDVQELNRLLFEAFEKKRHKLDIIKEMYGGKFVSKIQCLTCNNISEREEDFYDVTLCVTDSLERSLSEYCKIEHLQGSDQYECEKCNKKVDAHKWVSIRKAPAILQFSLIRFDYDWKNGTRHKIDTAMKFPLTNLSLEQYLEDPTSLSTAEYDVFGVIIHAGSPYAGHYHCLLRDTLGEHDKKPNDKETGESKWFDFNDERVIAITTEDIKKYYGGSRESAYMLVYRRRDLETKEVNSSQIPEALLSRVERLNQKLTLEVEKKLVEKKREQERKEQLERTFAIHVHLPNDFLVVRNLQLEKVLFDMDRNGMESFAFDKDTEVRTVMQIINNSLTVDSELGVYILNSDIQHRRYKLVHRIDLESELSLANYVFFKDNTHLLVLPKYHRNVYKHWYTSPLDVRIYDSCNFLEVRTILVNPMVDCLTLKSVVEEEIEIENNECTLYHLHLSTNTKTDKLLQPPKFISDSQEPIITALLGLEDRNSDFCLAIDCASVCEQMYEEQNDQPKIILNVVSPLFSNNISIVVSLNSTLKELKVLLNDRLTKLNVNLEDYDTEELINQQMVFKRQDSDSDFYDSDEDEERLLLDSKQNDSTFEQLHIRNNEYLELIILASSSQIQQLKEQKVCVHFIEIVPTMPTDYKRNHQYSKKNEFDMMVSLMTELSQVKDDIVRTTNEPDKYIDAHNFRFRKCEKGYHGMSVGDLIYDESKQLKSIFKNDETDEYTLLIELDMPPPRESISIKVYETIDWPPKHIRMRDSFHDDDGHNLYKIMEIEVSKLWTLRVLKQKLAQYMNIDNDKKFIWLREITTTLGSSPRVGKLLEHSIFLNQTIEKVRWDNNKRIAVQIVRKDMNDWLHSFNTADHDSAQQSKRSKKKKKNRASPPTLLIVVIRIGELSESIEILIELSLVHSLNDFWTQIQSQIRNHPEYNSLEGFAECSSLMNSDELSLFKFCFKDNCLWSVGDVALQSNNDSLADPTAVSHKKSKSAADDNIVRRYQIKDGDVLLISSKQRDVPPDFSQYRVASVEELNQRYFMTKLSQKEFSNDFWADVVPMNKRSLAPEVPLRIFTFEDEE